MSDDKDVTELSVLSVCALCLQNFLLPYVLSGFGDDNAAIALQCVAIVDACGRLYEADHVDDVSTCGLALALLCDNVNSAHFGRCFSSLTHC